MDTKGQSYSVFKLLIAAIVASAILLILLQVLGIAIFDFEQKPNAIASSQVNNNLNNIGDPTLTKMVTFQPQDSLNARTIAGKSNGLAEDQICVFKSTSTPNHDSFAGTDGQVLVYNGTLAQSLKLLVLCDTYDKISETIETYKYGDKYGVDSSLGECKEPSSETSKYCIVATVTE